MICLNIIFELMLSRSIVRFCFVPQDNISSGAKGDVVNSVWNNNFIGRPTNSRNIMRILISNSIYSLPSNGLNKKFNETVK